MSEMPRERKKSSLGLRVEEGEERRSLGRRETREEMWDLEKL